MRHVLSPQLLSTALFLGTRAGGRKIARLPHRRELPRYKNYRPAGLDVNEYLFPFALFSRL
jgi:hypothetical protein